MPPRSATADATSRPDCPPGAAPAVVQALVANHARFLSFLERRVGRRDVAEEILQEAFVRGIARGAQLRDDESAIAWFYRLLRNALVDHHRSEAARARGLAALAEEPRDEAVDGGVVDAELVEAICTCVGGLVDTLKPEYAEAIRRVDLGGESAQGFARDAGITPANAAVRLFRARQSLRRRIEESCGTCAEHGCYQCECRAERHAASAAVGV